jgi:hypothetical protein
MRRFGTVVSPSHEAACSARKRHEYHRLHRGQLPELIAGNAAFHRRLLRQKSPLLPRRGSWLAEVRDFSADERRSEDFVDPLEGSEDGLRKIIIKVPLYRHQPKPHREYFSCDQAAFATTRRVWRR